MSQYKPYLAYKDSGVEWLGMIPEHWRTSAVKWEFNSQLGKMLQPEKKHNTDTQVPYHKAISVQWEAVAFEAPETMWASPAEIESYRIAHGDLLICEGGDVGRSAIFKGDDTQPVIIQNSIHRVRPLKNNLNSVLLRLMQVCRASGWFDVLCSKATIVHFTAEKLGDLKFMVAPPNEQKIIAAYLDRETTRIDTLIERKTQFIELLREKRQALVTRAVTKGLDPTVKMKDSGFEWLGKVPEHWSVLGFQRCVAIAEGLVNPEISPYREMLLIAPNHIESGSGKIIFTETAFEQNAESGKYICNQGDIIYSKIRPALRKVCIASETCLCSADMYPMRGHSGMKNEFLFWFLLSEPFSAFAVLEADRVAMPKINRESLNDIQLPRPPMSEQQEIIDYLSFEAHQIDALLDKTECSISLLKERRVALITAAVTGKIDLREAV